MNKLDKMNTIAQAANDRGVSKVQAEQYHSLLKSVLVTIQNRMRHTHKLLDLSGCKIHLKTLEVGKEKCFYSEIKGKYNYIAMMGHDEIDTINAFSLWRENEEVIKAVDDMLYVLRYMDIIKPLVEMDIEIDVFNIEGDIMTNIVEIKSLSLS